MSIGLFSKWSLQYELSVISGFTDDGEGAAFARAEGLEGFDAVGHDAHHVALLRFVAPDLHG